MNRHERPANAQNRRTGGIWAILAPLWTVALAVLGVSYAPVDVPVVAETTYVTYLTEDMQDVDWTEHTGVRSLVRPDEKHIVDQHTQVLPLAPQLDWVNLNVLNGEEMVWCLGGTADPEFAQIVRDALNLTSQTYAKVRWRESCSGATYTIGDSSETDCGSQQAIGCASVGGLQFRGGKLSLSSRAVAQGIVRGTQGKMFVVGHEIEHIILTVAHTGCGSVPDAEPSNMSPYDSTNQRPCHVPPGQWIEPRDLVRAEVKYGLLAPAPTVTVTRTATATATRTATPTVAPTQPPGSQPYIQRWVLPAWEPGCTVNVINVWCMTRTGPFVVTSRGMWLQLVDANGNPLEWDGDPNGFKFVGPR